MSTSKFNIKDYSIEEIMDSIGEDTIELYLSNSSNIYLDIDASIFPQYI